MSAGILAGLSLASCDLTTESQSTFDETSVFSDPTLTEYQIYSIYEVFGHTNSHRGRYLPWYGYNTDIEWYISNTDDEKADIVKYNMLSTNSQLNVADGPYNELFAGIERANRGYRKRHSAQSAFIIGVAEDRADGICGAFIKTKRSKQSA